MKKRIKQGFTLVELVIVIAIIAILAAVLIPTFSNLITKANESADAQMVANLNKQLAISEITDGKNETMQEAIEDAKKAGYNTGAFLSTSNDILWDQETDRFLAVKKGNKVFACDENQKAYNVTGNCDYDYRYWKVYKDKDSIPKAKDQTYSVYWAGKESPAEDGNSLNVTVGFDAGEYEDKESQLIVVVYTSMNVKVRMYRGSLVIISNYAPTVDCYGVIDTLSISLGNSKDKGTANLNNAFVGYIISSGYLKNGNLVSNDAKFHEKYNDVKNIVEGLKEEDCEQHYPDEKTCVYCNKSSDSSPHTHTLTTEYTAPTCDDAGSITITCTTEGCSYNVTKTIDALGHVMITNDAEKGIKATCSTPGQDKGRVCIRCGYKEDGAIISPTFVHDTEGDGDSCSMCGKFGDNVPHVTISKDENGNIVFGDYLGDDFDRASQTIFVQLSNSIEIDVDDLRSALGCDKYFIGYDEDGNPHTAPRGHTALNFVDIDLNGNTLTITGKGNLSDGLLVGTANGYLRIRDSQKNKGKLILDGETAWGGFIALESTTAKVKLENIEIQSDWAPICVISEKNSVVIENSHLKTPKYYTAIGTIIEKINKWWNDDDVTYVNSSDNYKFYLNYQTIIDDIQIEKLEYGKFDKNLIKSVIKKYNEDNKNFNNAVKSYFFEIDNELYWIDTYNFYLNYQTKYDLNIYNYIHKVNEEFVSTKDNACTKVEDSIYMYTWGDVGNMFNSWTYYTYCESNWVYYFLQDGNDWTFKYYLSTPIQRERTSASWIITNVDNFKATIDQESTAILIDNNSSVNSEN